MDGEITLAIVEKDHKNLELGVYTDPLGVGFANGTVVAKNMEIDISDIIGGVNGIGQGWKFLMEALAAGRGTALPAGAAGSSKMLTNAVSGYSVLRKQFKVPIHSFEGIQEKLADMAIKTYEIDSLGRNAAEAIEGIVRNLKQQPTQSHANDKQKENQCFC